MAGTEVGRAVASGMRFQRGCRPVAVRTRDHLPAGAHRWGAAAEGRPHASLEQWFSGADKIRPRRVLSEL